MNETITAFGYPQSLLKEFQHWVVLLRPKQVTVGSLVIAAKSDALHLGELTEEVWAEFSTVSRSVELALINAFKAEKFNYLALMMVDPNVHFHVIPRYSKSVDLLGVEFTDPEWPKKTEMNPVEVTDSQQEELKRRLLAHFDA